MKQYEQLNIFQILELAQVAQTLCYLCDENLLGFSKNGNQFYEKQIFMFFSLN